MNARGLRFILISGIILLMTGLLGCSNVNSPNQIDTQSTGSRAAISQVSSFGSNPGNLTMYKYAPANPKANAGLVVAMHGCTQSANEYADRTGWNDLADEYGFYVVYPQQPSSNNQNACFNWFESGDISRGYGEALSIKNMVEYMKSNYSIDASRVYVTGLSAGAYMTVVMAAAYPDVFAGAAPMAGGPYKCGVGMTNAFSCMSPGVDKTPAQWGDIVRSAYSSYSGKYPLMSIFQGTGDYTVKPLNATELVDQWTNLHGTDQTPEVSETFRGHDHKVYYDASGKPVVEIYMMQGMGHAITVDPGTADDQGGTTGAYTEDRDIYSSYYAMKFWGLDQSDRNAPTVSLTAPSDGSSVSGSVSVTANASDDVEVAKVEFYVNGTVKATDTTAPYSFSWDASSVYNGNYTITAKAIDTSGNSAEDSATVSVTGGATDTTSPSVNVTSPANGETVHGTTVIAVSASDAGTGVAKVEFYIDGSKVGEDTSAPYEYSWDSAAYSDGTHAIKAVAVDGAGNTAIDNDTTVTSNQVVICHTATADGTATDHYVAGRLDSTGYTTYGTKYGYSTVFTLYQLNAENGGSWVDVDGMPDGCYVEGVSDDTAAPSVNVTAPSNGTTVSGTVSITVDASDNNSVSKVEFYIDGTKVGEDTAAPYSYSWNTSNASDGSHAIKAVAFDAAGNSAADNDTSVTVDNSTSGGTCQQWTAKNSDHVTAGRAYSSWGYYYAKGSNQYIGYGSWSTTTVKETSDGYYEKGSCQ